MVMGLESVLDSADPWPSAKASVPPSVPPLAAHSGPSLHRFAAQGYGSEVDGSGMICTFFLAPKTRSAKREATTTSASFSLFQSLSPASSSLSGSTHCKLPGFLPLLSIPCHGRCQGNSSRSGWWRDSRLSKASHVSDSSRILGIG